jgi:exonuclease SbcD
MERLRERFPHALQLDFMPASGGINPAIRAVDISQLNPVEVTHAFIEYVSGSDPNEKEAALIEEAVERVRQSAVK